MVLGGEPPGGTDHIPVIEIKDNSNKEKGSKGSKKIDLIAFKDPFFLLLELKKLYANSDVIKLDEITQSSKLRRAFLDALNEKKVLDKHKIKLETSQYLSSSKFFIKSIGYNKSDKLGPEDYITYLVSPDKIETKYGENISDDIKSLFNSS